MEIGGEFDQISIPNGSGGMRAGLAAVDDHGLAGSRITAYTLAFARRSKRLC